MRRALLRSIAGAALAAAIVGLGELIYFAAFCPQHAAWARTTADPARPVRDDGFGVARPGDALYVCTTTHCTGPLCHEDRDCYCAAATLGAAGVGRLLQGECTVDKRQPTRADTDGACRYARCGTHID